MSPTALDKRPAVAAEAGRGSCAEAHLGAQAHVAAAALPQAFRRRLDDGVKLTDQARTAWTSI
jgi:hypothetical protein